MSVLKRHYFRVYAAPAGPYAEKGIKPDDECFVQEPEQASQCGMDMQREYEGRDLFWVVLTEKLTRAIRGEVQQ
ncbi:hypothetical protein CO670_15295 [Rhizobium sp. J15]|uniref:hypothetical protein n=1 Tax=Rhizobium sp. J15 TaxID=2035450 RepID=UPI000BE7CD7E|nr:hypothetical protein [Rhizobium sp. J15]PDT15860.1 hypothetical protein CO670_15295 [Rhizobium sp. J15]